MARTIKKKLIDDDMMLSDDFDEKFLDKIDKEFAGKQSETGQNRASRVTGEDKGFIDTSDFSLDDFAGSPDADPKPFKGQGSQEGAHPTLSEGAKDGSSEKKTGSLSASAGIRIARNKAFMIVGACVALVLAVTFVLALWYESPEPAPQVITLVRHSIAIPQQQQEMEFLLLLQTAKSSLIQNSRF